MKFNRYLIHVGFITLGVLLGVFFCNYSFFEFEKTIKISDLASLVITSLIGIYIATNVNRVFTKNHSEKEILIDEVKKILSKVNKLLTSVNAKRLEFNSTTSSFKNINENLVLLESLIASSHCRKVDLKNLRIHFTELRRVITRISPQNGFIMLDNTNFQDIHLKTLVFKTSFYNLIFDINKQ